MTWYVVMRKYGWDSIPNSPWPLKWAGAPDEPSAYLPVFDTLKAAKKRADGAPIQAIRERAKKGNDHD